MATEASGAAHDSNYDVRLLGGALEASLGGNDGEVVRIPTAPKQLHALLTLVLLAPEKVAPATIRQVLYGSLASTYTDKALQTPLSRLRNKHGWPVSEADGEGLYQLSVAKEQVDILDFDKRAQQFLQSFDNRASASSASSDGAWLDELVCEGQDLDRIWRSDPSVRFQKTPSVAALFEPFERRHERFLAAFAQLLARKGNLSEAEDVLGRLDEKSNRPGSKVPENMSRRAREEVARYARSEGSEPVDVPVSSASPAISSLLTAYLTDVKRRAAALSFGDPSSWLSDHSTDHITLDQVWTPVRAADSKSREGKTGTHESMAEGDEGSPLLDLVRGSDAPLVILGDPGSGKSSSIGMIAIELAGQADHGRLPIWVNLPAIAVGGGKLDPEQLLVSGVPEVEMAAARKGEVAGSMLREHLQQAILDGTAVLLLDGLDEVKEYALDTVRQAISVTERLANGTRVIVTCRKFDYRQDRPNRRVSIDRELELLPLNEAEKVEYVSRWYGAAAKVGGFSPALAERLSQALTHELRDVPEISEMAELPLLLTLLTLIHSKQELPDSRSVVCDQAIRFMLAEAPPWREREPGASVEASGPVVRLAVEVAFQAHLSEEAEGDLANRGITTDLIRSEAEKLHNTLRLAGPGHFVPAAEDLGRQFVNSHGLLLETSSGHYKFAHRYFQEFLAGQHYALGAEEEEAILRGASLHWREPFRLMASYAGHDGNNLHFIRALIRSLLKVEGSVASQQLGAEMLAEITRARLALWGYEGELGEEGLWAGARRLVATQVEDASLSLPQRERAGTVLSLLGDPRFVDAYSSPVTVDVNLVPVRGGSSIVGTSRLGSEDVVGGFAAEPRELDFAPFLIGKYPVTNAEYGAFMAGGGYTNLDYWPAERGRAWAAGDPVVLGEIRQHWMETVYEHHAKEIRDGEISEAKLEEECVSRTKPLGQPFYWNDRRFNQANQPVVGINWWEAAAYCAWATSRAHETGSLDTSYVAVLPTEFEWELASRPLPDDRVYPWGDAWDDERAHLSTNVLNMRQTSPVGIYLEPWPGAPRDLAGNVWEWTASLFLPGTDNDHDQERLDPDSFGERVVKGSSWYNRSGLAACSARAVDRSYNLFYDVGFRVVVVKRDAPRAGCA